jgi:hypothetical protein
MAATHRGLAKSSHRMSRSEDSTARQLDYRDRKGFASGGPVRRAAACCRQCFGDDDRDLPNVVSIPPGEPLWERRAAADRLAAGDVHVEVVAYDEDGVRGQAHLGEHELEEPNPRRSRKRTSPRSSAPRGSDR